MTAIDIEVLQSRGWTMKTTSGPDDLLSLATSLGTPMPSRSKGNVIDELRPTPREKAESASLSAQYGTGIFPLHTDTAHWRRPARYMLLRAATATCGSRPTLLVDGFQLLTLTATKSYLENAVFSVHNGKQSFLSMIAETTSTSRVIRFDPGCMKPKCEIAQKGLNDFNTALQSLPITKIEWAQGDTLIVDNWRCLHGRSAGLNNDTNTRVLQRVLINKIE
jgi:alpha-ketoglutarate-dependent taurine dioxygenase